MLQLPLECPQSSLHANSAFKLEGFWAEDEWDMNNAPLAKFWRSEVAVKLRFDLKNPFLKQELKWIIYRQFLQKRWSPGNKGIGINLQDVSQWLNESNYCVTSFSDRSLDQWVSDLQAFILAKGKQRNYIVRRTNICSWSRSLMAI